MEDRSGLFNEIQGFSQRKLKKVETKVVTGTGDKLVEKRGAKGLQATKESGSAGSGSKGSVQKKLDLQVGLVLPGLLIASDDVAQHKQTLEEYCVTHILNLANSEVCNSFEDDYNYKSLDVIDSNHTNIKKIFDDCFDFIDEGRQRGNCLVHCNASTPGLSRSTTICVAYVMCKEKKKFTEAFNEVKEARPFVKPNDGFMQQLREYEAELFGKQEQTEVQDAFTLRKRQEIEAEKEMLKNKVSIKDKLKAFAPTTLDVPDKGRSASPSPNRIRADWFTGGNTNQAVPPENCETSGNQANNGVPAPKKLTSILSIFQQPKDANNTPNRFVKNTTPTRKWKPVEIKSLQGTKGPEVKKQISYEKLRKSKSKEWKGREVKKAKSKVLGRNDSGQSTETKPKEESLKSKDEISTKTTKETPIVFTATVSVKSSQPENKDYARPEVPKEPQRTESSIDPNAPWRRPRTVEQSKPQTASDSVNSNVTNITVITSAKKPEEKQEESPKPKPEQVSETRRVFGRIPPPPMKIIGRDVSLSDERRPSTPKANATMPVLMNPKSGPAPPPPPPPPQPVINRTQDPEKKITVTATASASQRKPIQVEESEEEEESESEEETEEESEEESEEEEPTNQNAKGLNRSSTLEILKLIKSKTQVLEDSKRNESTLGTVDEDEEIDTLLDGLKNEGIENIDWGELGIELDEVKDIVAKAKNEETESEEEEESEEEDEDEDEEEEEEESEEEVLLTRA